MSIRQSRVQNACAKATNTIYPLSLDNIAASHIYSTKCLSVRVRVCLCVHVCLCVLWLTASVTCQCAWLATRHWPLIMSTVQRFKSPSTLKAKPQPQQPYPQIWSRISRKAAEHNICLFKCG